MDVPTSFKTEITAVATPPAVFFHPTLENYYAVLQRADYLAFARNSVVVSLGSTLLALALAIPAAYSMAFFPTRRTRDILLWMLSTKMLPAVGVLVPIYLLWRDLGLLDTRLRAGPDRQPQRSAHRGVDALFLFPGSAGA